MDDQYRWAGGRPPHSNRSHCELSGTHLAFWGKAGAGKLEVPEGVGTLCIGCVVLCEWVYSPLKHNMLVLSSHCSLKQENWEHGSALRRVQAPAGLTSQQELETRHYCPLKGKILLPQWKAETSSSCLLLWSEWEPWLLQEAKSAQAMSFDI